MYKNMSAKKEESKMKMLVRYVIIISISLIFLVPVLGYGDDNSRFYGIHSYTMDVGSCTLEGELTIGDDEDMIGEEDYLYIPSGGDYVEYEGTDQNNDPFIDTVLINDNEIYWNRAGQWHEEPSRGWTQRFTITFSSDYKDAAIEGYSTNDDFYDECKGELTGGILKLAAPVESRNILGKYKGKGSMTLKRCDDPDDNGRYGFKATVDITEQHGNSFSGKTVLKARAGGNKVKEIGQFQGSMRNGGRVSGTITSDLYVNGSWDSHSRGNFKGKIRGKKLVVTYSARNTRGDSCISKGKITASLVKRYTPSPDPEPDYYTLTVNMSGSGAVTSSPNGINCGNDCSQNYSSGTSVTLTASPTSGWIFSSWSGCSSTSGNKCYVTMNSNKNVTATFTVSLPSMSITITSLPSTDNDGSYTLKWTCSGLCPSNFSIKESGAANNTYTYYVSGNEGGTYSKDFSGKSNGTYCYKVGSGSILSSQKCVTVSISSQRILWVINDLDHKTYTNRDGTYDWGKWNQVLWLRIASTMDGLYNVQNERLTKRESLYNSNIELMDSIDPLYRQTASSNSREFDVSMYGNTYYVLIQLGWWDYEAYMNDFGGCNCWRKHATASIDCNGNAQSSKFVILEINHTSGRHDIHLSEWIPDYASWTGRYCQ